VLAAVIPAETHLPVRDRHYGLSWTVSHRAKVPTIVWDTVFVAADYCSDMDGADRFMFWALALLFTIMVVATVLSLLVG
jgi:hypothetical protein